MSEDIVRKSAGELAADVAARRLSATEVTRAFLERTAQVNPAVNAVCTLNPRAKEDAAAGDRRLSAGEPPRPLEGVPFVVKDILQTAGLRTTFGSMIHEHFVPDEDAVSVARLRAAGAILLGKTNTPEFAHDVNTTNKIFGTTRNPWNLRTTAGGSSGGTGAAIAADLAPIGLGTDLGGSIRIPAAFCGISGIRPVPGRVPVYPAEFGWDTLVEHVHGPMARGVADVGLVLAALAGPDDRDPTSLPAPAHDYATAALGHRSLAGRRLAYTRDLRGLVPVDPEVARLTREAARVFERLDCVVEEDCFDTADVRDIIAGTRGFGMVARYADRLDQFKDRMTTQLVNQVTDALRLDVRTITRAERLRTAYWHRVRAFLERYDYILTPTVGVPAFHTDRPLPSEIGGVKVERFYDVFLTTYAFSVTGLPVASVPCGFTEAGLPVGLQIVGRRLREDLVLEAAGAYAVACPQHFVRPPRIDPDAARDIRDAVVTTGFNVTAR
ncbi:MAG TPA: amidase family protein [Methylomirabilota bacterium]|nr:amidase family protein [Methylomirabilota bacterium]